MEQTFTISPFGTVKIHKELHRGKLFTIYQAELEGQLVCLKTPSASLIPDSTPAGFFKADYSISEGSEVFVRGRICPGLSEVPRNPVNSNKSREELDLLNGFVINEALLIAWSQGAWNHQVLGLGTWDILTTSLHSDHGGFSATQEVSESRFLPVLVMALHQATPLAHLPREEKRVLFPRMLPALWVALSKLYHADLSETNLLLQLDQQKFHLIDPGVIITSSRTGPTGGLVLQDEIQMSYFTTTAANYPLLAPFEDPNLDSSISSFYQATDLLTYLRLLVVGWRTDNIHSLVARRPQELTQAPAARARPNPSDLLALGLIYFRILTGEELFLGRPIMPQTPVWMTEWNYSSPSFKSSLREGYRRVLEQLENNYFTRELDSYSLKQAERKLVLALLNLEISDYTQLMRLVEF